MGDINPVKAQIGLHASTHLSGQTDAIKIDDLAAGDDNTDLNASTTKHGLMMKFPGGSTNFLREDGTWAAPPGGGGGDTVTVNGAAVTDIDLDDADPAAPSNAVNVKWQLNTATSPDSVSAYLDVNTVSNFILADMAANTAKVRAAGTSGDPSDLSIPANTVLGRKGSNIVAEPIDTNQVNDDAITYAKIQNIATDKVLGRDSTGSGNLEEIGVTGGIEFDTSGNLRTSAFTGDVTKTAGGTALTIASNAVTTAKILDDNVTYAKIQNVVNDDVFLGRISGADGIIEELTKAQATSLMNVFTDSLQGVVPASGGGSTNFLRADGQWAAPPGAGGGEANTASNIGGEKEVWKDKVGVDLRFRTLKEGANITITQNANDLTIAASGGGGGDNISVNGAAATDADLDDADPAAPTDAVNVKWQINTGATPDSISAYLDVNTVTNKILADMAGFTVKAKATTGSGDPGDVSIAADRVLGRSGSGDIDDIQIVTNHIADDQVTFAKMQDVATNSLLGRDTAATGNIETILLNATLEMDGSGNLQRAALTGDVTASAGSNTTAIAAGAIVDADINASGITTRSKLPSPIVYDDEANVMGDFNFELHDDKLIIWNPARTFKASLVCPAITGDLTLNLPNVTSGTHTIVSRNSSDQLQNKTFEGIKFAHAVKTGNYTMTATDISIAVDGTSSAFTITLPAAATAGNGTIYKITRTDVVLSTNVITIDANGSETISGMLTWILMPGEFIQLVSDGSNWHVHNYSNPAQVGYFYRKGSSDNRRYPAGWHSSLGTPGTSTTSPITNELYAVPFLVAKPTKFDTISFNITTSQASQNARAGLYYDNGNMYPGALIFDTGNISTASTGVKDTTITSSLQILQPGLYWLVFHTGASTIQIKILSTTSGTTWNVMGSDNTLTGNHGYAWQLGAGSFGALPNPFTGGGSIMSSTPSASNAVPYITLRAV